MNVELAVTRDPHGEEDDEGLMVWLVVGEHPIPAGQEIVMQGTCEEAESALLQAHVHYYSEVARKIHFGEQALAAHGYSAAKKFRLAPKHQEAWLTQYESEPVADPYFTFHAHYSNDRSPNVGSPRMHGSYTGSHNDSV